MRCRGHPEKLNFHFVKGGPFLHTGSQYLLPFGSFPINHEVLLRHHESLGPLLQGQLWTKSYCRPRDVALRQGAYLACTSRGSNPQPWGKSHHNKSLGNLHFGNADGFTMNVKQGYLHSNLQFSDSGNSLYPILPSRIVRDVKSPLHTYMSEAIRR